MKLNEVLLLYISENNLFYEIVDLLGMENALKLVNVFGGEKIEIPSRATIKDSIINVMIYATLCPTAITDSEGVLIFDIDLLQMLMNRFSLTDVEIKKRYKKTVTDFKTGCVSKVFGLKAKDITVSDIEQYILELAD